MEQDVSSDKATEIGNSVHENATASLSLIADAPPEVLPPMANANEAPNDVDAAMGADAAPIDYVDQALKCGEEWFATVVGGPRLKRRLLAATALAIQEDAVEIDRCMKRDKFKRPKGVPKEKDAERMGVSLGSASNSRCAR